MPQEALNVAAGSISVRSSPELKASGGAVIGSTAMLTRGVAVSSAV